MATISRILRARLLGNVRGDLLGGLTAGIVALPLALGFGVASGIEGGAAAGLYGAIAVGFFAALFGGTPSQVSGPTGPMTVVVAGIAASFAANGHDPKLVFLAVLLGGALQLVFAALRLGKFIQYVPYPVISGFMSGIGVIVVLLQLPVLFGYAAVSKPLDGIRTLPAAVSATNAAALGLALGTIAVIYLTPRITRAVPGTLVGLVVFTTIAAAAGLNVPTIGEIPSGLPELRVPPLGLDVLLLVLPAAIALAALGSIDSLLTSLIADKVSGVRHHSDQELVGQGIGNIVSGLFGGLAGAGATMRTLVNFRSGGRTHLSGVVHSVFLLGILLGLGSLAARVPLAVLAGILVTVGIGIIDYKGLRHIARAPRADSAVMVAVLVITVAHDLMWAVGVGTVLSALLLVKRFGDMRAATHKPLAELQGWTPPPSASPDALEGVHVLQCDGPLFFGNALGLQDAAAGLDAARKVVVSLDGVLYLDQSGAYALEDLLRDLRAQGKVVYLAGVSDDLRRLLERLDLVPGLVGHEAVFTRKEDALLTATGAEPDRKAEAAVAVA